MKTIEAPIQRVIVYTDRARITRQGQLQLGAGEHQLVLPNLPFSLLDNTVRAASSNPLVRMLDVVVGVQATTAPRAEEIEAFQERFDALQDQDDALLDDDTIEADRLAFLRDLYNSASAELGSAIARGEIPFDNINHLMEYMSQQQRTSTQRRREIAEERRSIADQLQQLNKEMPPGLPLKRRKAPAQENSTEEKQNEERPEGGSSLLRRLDRNQGPESRREEAPNPFGRRLTNRNQRKILTMTLFVEEDTELDLSISYAVNQASWTPSYDVRVTESGTRLSLIAEIRQNTGENWPLVPITLSTARPMQDANVPRIKPWVIEAERPSPPPRRSPFGRSTTNNDNNSGSRIFGRRPPPPPPPRRSPFGSNDDNTNNSSSRHTNNDNKDLSQGVQFDQEPAQINGTSPTVTFEAQKPLAVPSDYQIHKAFIDTYRLESDMELMAIPEQAETAFLCAHIKNTSTNTLLSGAALIFFDNQFIGRTNINTIAPRQTFTVQLGEQEHIRVERQLDKHSSTRSPEEDKSRTEFIYRIRVHNDSEDEVQLMVYDHIPITKHKDIQVHVRAISPQPIERTDATNIFKWQMTLQPGNNDSITMGFALDHPPDMKIVSKRT